MPSKNDIRQQLEQLCQEYSVALRLEQHERVSGLCLSICGQLIGLFDEELLQNDLEEGEWSAEVEGKEARLDQDFKQADGGQAASVMASDEWRLVNLVCQRLRKQSILSQFYGEVLEFVRERERACLAQLRELEPAGCVRPGLAAEQLEGRECARVLRKCIVLLRELPNRFKRRRRRRLENAAGDEDGDYEDDDEEEKFDLASSWLPRTRIRRLNGTVGFARYALDLSDLELASGNAAPPSGEPLRDPIERLLASCKEAQGAADSSAASPSSASDEDTNDSSTSIFYKLISARWFAQFLDQLAFNTFRGFDRFSVLVALWMIAGACQHAALEQLLGELVGQIFHQETNSCQPDEFLLLSQPGAIWLSYKKRILASANAAAASQLHHHQRAARASSSLSSSSDEDSPGDSTSGPKRARNSSSSASSGGSRGGDGRAKADQPRRGVATKRRAHDESAAAAHLRQLIDAELLIGRECLRCARRPSGRLLEPLQLRACPQCQLTLIAPNHFASSYCNASLAPLDWLAPLADLLRPPPSRLAQAARPNRRLALVLTPNEWLQHALEVCATLGARFSLFAGEKQDAGDDDDGGQSQRRRSLGERVDISDKFQRLTVLRPGELAGGGGRGSSEEEEEEESEDADASESAFEDFSGGENQELEGGGDDESNGRELEREGEGGREQGLEPQALAGDADLQLSACLQSLRAFFKWRYARICAHRGRPLAGETQRLRELSESIQFLKRNLNALALNGADLLVVDSLEQSLKVCLRIRRQRPGLASGGVEATLACHLRSQTSQLQRGCGRLFQASALVERPPGSRASFGGGDSKTVGTRQRGANEFNMAPEDEHRAGGAPPEPSELKCPVCANELAPIAPGDFAASL